MSGYPKHIDGFVAKLNKRPSGVYVIEEEKVMSNGVWEGYLDHDNVNHVTVQIWTESRFAGEKISNYFLSIDSDMPWKTYLKVFSESDKIYVSYETSGDQVEAEDINRLQDSVTATQTEIERYKRYGVIDGGAFIKESEG